MNDHKKKFFVLLISSRNSCSGPILGWPNGLAIRRLDHNLLFVLLLVAHAHFGGWPVCERLLEANAGQRGVHCLAIGLAEIEECGN